MNACESAFFALDAHLAAVGGDDAVGDGEAQAAVGGAALCREEGIKYLVPDPLRNTGAAILHGKPNPVDVGLNALLVL